MRSTRNSRKLAARAGIALAAVLIPLNTAMPSFAATTPQNEVIQIESDSALLDRTGHEQYVTTQPDNAYVNCYTTNPPWGYGTWYFLAAVFDPNFPGDHYVWNLWTAAENFQIQPQVPHC